MEVSVTGSGSHSLFHNDRNRTEMFKVCVTKDFEKLQNIDDGQIVEANKVLTFQRDDLSCISKADASNTMAAGHQSETERKNVSCSSGSVNSVFREGLERSVQSNKHCPDNGQSILEEGNTDSGRQNQCSEEAVHSTVDFSDKSDPWETSLFRERAAAEPMQKGESFGCLEDQGDSSPVRPVNSSADAHTLKFDARCCDDNSLIGKGAAADGNQHVSDAKSSFDIKEHSALNVSLDVPIDKPLQLQSPAVEETGGFDELVDVRVCDICGDAGREALLAICSKCNDGAEHIYCMQVKMHKIPDGDWMCEECMMMQGTHTERFTEDVMSAGALKPSAGKLVHGSQKLNCRAELSENKIASTSRSSCKTPESGIKVSPSDKQRAVENKEQSAKLSGSSRRAVLPQVLFSKIMDEGKHLAHLGSSSDGRSLSKIKPFKSLDMKVETRGVHIQEKRKVSEVTAACRGQRNTTFEKLSKSMSFNGVGKTCLDVSDSKAKIIEESKYLRHKTVQKTVQRSYSFKTDRSKAYQPLGEFGAAKLSINQRTAVSGQVKSPSLVNKGHDGKDAKVPGSLNLSNPSIALQYKGPKHAKGTATYGIEKRQSSSQAGGRSPCHAKAVISSHRLTNHSQITCTKQEDSDHPVPTDKVLQNNLPTLGDLPLFDTRKDVFPGASVVPKLEYIWKGLFKLEDGGKLPNHCHGIQAHPSTSASPRVSDIVLKFSHELLLKDFPRMDNWPVRFQKTCPKEEDIALYFFAEDLQSFKSYRRMVECMVQNDLALKGNFDGVELLILPSNLLPQNSQRWNNFYFLWGVFRASKATFPGYLSVSGPQEACQVPNSSGVNLGKESSVPIVCGLQHTSPTVLMDGGLYLPSTLSKPNQEPDRTNLVGLQSSASAKCMDQTCEAEVCLQKKRFGSVEVFDCSPDGAEAIPSASNSSRRERLSGGMRHANDSQEKSRYLNNGTETALGGEIGNQASRRERSFVPDDIDGCKEIEGQPNGKDNSSLFEGVKPLRDTGFPWMKAPASREETFEEETKKSAYSIANIGFPWMKAPAPREETFKEERKDSAYSMNATENLQTMQGSLAVVPGVSGPVNTGGCSWANEWQVALGETSIKSEISTLNLALVDEMGDEEPGLKYQRYDPVPRYEADNIGGDQVSLELSLALPCSSKDFPDVDTSLVLGGGNKN